MRRIVAPGLALYCLVAGWAPFLRLGPSTAWLYPWIAGYLFLFILVAYEAYVSPPSSSPVYYVPFRFVVLGIVLLNFAVQVTGGAGSMVLSVYFLFAMFAAAHSRPWKAYGMASLIVAIEAANLFLVGRADHSRLYSFAGFSISLVGVSAAASHLVHRNRSRAEQALLARDNLIAHAASIDPRTDPGHLESLTPAHRQATHLRTVLQREIDFNGLIEMIYGFVPAHTYALFLRDTGEDARFSLRALRTESEHAVLPVGTGLDPSRRNLIDICARQRQSQYLSDIASMSMPLANLGYYRPDTTGPAVRSYLVIPIVQNDLTVAVLAVDSLEPGAFSLETQDMFEKFAPFFLQIIEKIGLTLDLQNRADHFRELHAISTDLNSSLKFSEIMNTVLPKIQKVVPFDLCACVLRSGLEGQERLNFAALHGYDPSFLGASFPLADSPIAVHMHTHWQQQGYLKYYTADFGERGKDIGLFPFKELRRPIRSMYGRLLVAKDDLVGAFFVASFKPDAFDAYNRDVLLDTLMNQISQVADNSLLHQRIEGMARTDGLTGLLNHRTFMEKLQEKYRELDRNPRPFSILLMDIDKFKNVNDTYGHPVGDVAIKAVARVLTETVRTTDFVARYGGEEFAVGLVETDQKGAELMAERVRKNMERTVVTRVPDGELKITLSIGVVTFPDDSPDHSDMLAMADEALYHAKRSGRNRVSLYRDAAKDPLATSAS